MKVKSRQKLEETASFIFQDLEKDYLPCETAFIISELAKTLSFVMLTQATVNE